MTLLSSVMSSEAISRNRDLSFDFIKGIAIYMVVLLHTFFYVDNCKYGNTYIPTLLAQISVPIFFVVSGILNGRRRISSTKLLVKTTALLFPFLIWGLLYDVIDFRSMAFSDITLKVSIRNLIQSEYFYSPIWFLKCLILQLIIMYISEQISEDYAGYVLIIFWILSLVSCVFFTADYGLEAFKGNSPYFITGFFISRYNILGRGTINTLLKIMFPLFLLCNMLNYSILQWGGVERVNNFFLIISFVFLLKSIYTQNKLCYLISLAGKQSLEIYVTHFLFVYLCVYFSIHTIEPTYVCFLLYALIILLLSFFLSKIIEKAPLLNMVYGKTLKPTMDSLFLLLRTRGNL